MKLPCYAHIYKGNANREAKLKEVHRLCTKVVQPAGKPAIKTGAVVLNNS
jgi:hypothetical protein